MGSAAPMVRLYPPVRLNVKREANITKLKPRLLDTAGRIRFSAVATVR